MPAQLHQDTAEDQIQPHKHQLRPGMRQFLPASLESLMTQERTEQRTAYRGHDCSFHLANTSNHRYVYITVCFIILSHCHVTGNKKGPSPIGESPLLATRFRVANYYSSKGIHILDTPFLPFLGKTHLLIFE